MRRFRFSCRNKFRHEIEKLAFRSDLPPHPKLIFWIPAYAGMTAEKGKRMAANNGNGGGFDNVKKLMNPAFAGLENAGVGKCRGGKMRGLENGEIPDICKIPKKMYNTGGR